MPINLATSANVKLQDGDTEGIGWPLRIQAHNIRGGEDLDLRYSGLNHIYLEFQPRLVLPAPCKPRCKRSRRVFQVLVLLEEPQWNFELECGDMEP